MSFLGVELTVRSKQAGVSAAGVGVLQAGAGAGTARPPAGGRPPRPTGGDHALRAAPVPGARSGETESAPAAVPAEVSLEAPRVAIKEIAFDPQNDQTRHVPELGADVSDITDTMDTTGIMTPLVIVEVAVYTTAYPKYENFEGFEGKTFVAMEGNRRLLAAHIKKQKDVPVNLRSDLVRDGKDAAARVISNLRRKQYSPIAEAVEFSRMEASGKERQEIASEVGCGAPHVTKRLKLLDLPDEVQLAVARGQISGTAGYEIASATADKTIMLAAFELMRERGITSGSKAIRIVSSPAKARPEPPQEQIDADATAFASRDAFFINHLTTTPAGEVPSDAVDMVGRAYLQTFIRKPGRNHAAALPLAHSWLTASGIGQPLEDPLTYAAAAVEEPAILAHLLYALALAEDELHARTRTKWDERAKAHNRRMRNSGYYASSWEAERLAG
jgi:ParB/RepB/Spo0J family partition protein